MNPTTKVTRPQCDMAHCTLQGYRENSEEHLSHVKVRGEALC